MPSRGFQSSVEPVLNFGLGDHQIIDSLVVRWPNQKTQTLKNIPADTTITLIQKDATEIFIPAIQSKAPAFIQIIPLPQ